MIIKCPECGKENVTDKPIQPDRRYRCGKCGAVITFLQTDDAQDELTNPLVTNETDNTPKENTIMKLLKSMRTGGFYVGTGTFLILFNIVQFAVPAVVGLSMIWWAITLFFEGSIIWGLLVLLIGTPIAIGIAFYVAIFLFFIGIITVITWGILSLFGVNISFESVWSIVWLGIRILLLGGMAFIGVSSFVQAVKENELASFFKGNWFYILLFFFLFWLFF